MPQKWKSWLYRRCRNKNAVTWTIKKGYPRLWFWRTILCLARLLHSKAHSHCLCTGVPTANLRSGLASNLYVMSQITLAHLFKSGLQWPQRKRTLSAINIKAALQCLTLYIHHSTQWTSNIQLGEHEVTNIFDWMAALWSTAIWYNVSLFIRLCSTLCRNCTTRWCLFHFFVHHSYCCGKLHCSTHLYYCKWDKQMKGESEPLFAFKREATDLFL